VLHTGNRLAGTDTVGVVGVGVAVKALQLATLLPGQSMAQVSERVALLMLVYPHFPVMSILEKQPHPERCGC
jgi:hypothetical protein